MTCVSSDLTTFLLVKKNLTVPILQFLPVKKIFQTISDYTLPENNHTTPPPPLPLEVTRNYKGEGASIAKVLKGKYEAKVEDPGKGIQNQKESLFSTFSATTHLFEHKNQQQEICK